MHIHILRNTLKEPSSPEINFSNEEIEVLVETYNNDLISNGLKLITFTNCVFKGSEIVFEKLKKERLKIRFIECSFECTLKFEECRLLGLQFIDTKKISRNLELFGNTIYSFFLKNKTRKSQIELNSNIDITNNIFVERVNFENLNHLLGTFQFLENTFQTKKINPGSHDLKASFKNSTFHSADFSYTNFGEEVSFDKMILLGGEGISNFTDCIFGKAYFNNTNFGKYAFFNGSIFNGVAIFNGCQSLKHTITDFSGLTFKEEVYFDSSQFKDLTLKYTNFQAKSSFENTKFGTVCLNQVIFEKPAFFDDIFITEIEKCDRKSIRAIKEQLQKTDNRIDYNRFRALELDAYSRELKKSNWKDRSILWFNSISSNHGLNWFQALKFTLVVGIIIYIPYFLSENHMNDFELSYSSINYFVKGYFGFLIPSYSSPIENGLTQWYQYFIFIIGKIFISYGIYQTIVSFRKFRL